jgi:hypothetical protein
VEAEAAIAKRVAMPTIFLRARVMMEVAVELGVALMRELEAAGLSAWGPMVILL